MKTPLFKLHLLAALLTFAGAAAPAASLTITPAVVTNDFVGKITFAITGVPVGSPVIVDRFADLNNNGVVDPGEPLLQRFAVADGRQPLIGGVRNLNRPGDEDGATNGQLRVELFYPDVDGTFDHFEGNYLYSVSHPTGAFPPVRQSFAVRQKVFPQGIRGRITDAATGAPLTNASVVLLSGMGIGLGGSVINSNGYYALLTAPGSYLLWAVQDGYVGNMAAGAASVSSGQFATNNITLLAGTNIVTGRVSDATNGTGLAGIGIMAESADNRYAVTFTDTNGSYRLKLTSGLWGIGFNQSQMPLLGYVGAHGRIETNITGAASGLDFQVPKANALIYGFVTDDQTNAVIGVSVYADDLAGQLEADARSYPTNGAFCLGVLAGTWHVEPDPDQLSGSGYSGQGIDVTVAAGEAARADVVLRRVTAHIIGRVLDETNAPVSNIFLGASGSAGDWLGTQTDGNGRFDLGVFAGTWHLSLSSDEAQQRGLLSADLSLTVTNGQTLSNVVYRVRHVTARITGTVRNDTGNPIPMLGVWTFALINGTNYNAYTQTDGTGYYELGVINGYWTLGLDCNGLSAQGYDCPGNQNVTVSGGNKLLNFTVFSTPPTPVLESPTLMPDGSFTFIVSGAPGHLFDVQVSSDLNNWAWLLSTNPPGGVFQFTDPNPASHPARFFRVQVH